MVQGNSQGDKHMYMKVKFLGISILSHSGRPLPCRQPVTTSKHFQDKPQTRRKYLESAHPTVVLYPEDIENSQKLIRKLTTG